MTTAATYSRTVTVDLPDYASTTITFRLLSTVAIAAGASEIFPIKAYTLALDANGTGSTALPCPDNTGDSSWLWRVEFPDKKQPQFTLAYNASSISLVTLLAAAASDTTSDELLELVDDVLGGSGTVDQVWTNDGDGTASWQNAAGSAPDAEDVVFTPAGNIAATDVQAAIEELDTEKSGTGHAHAGTYDPAGTAAAAVSAHEADTTNVHGIADTSALVDTGDIGSLVQGYDDDLAAIAGIFPSNDDIIQRKAGAWTNRTMAQLLTDLSTKLNAINALTWAANSIILLTGTATASVQALASHVVTFVQSADAAAARVAILSAPLRPDLNAQTGTSYTFVLTDESKIVTGNNASAITFTVPPNSSVAFPVGTIIGIQQIGAGLITMTQGSGVTLRWYGGTGNKALAGQYANAAIRKSATDTWELVGRLA